MESDTLSRLSAGLLTQTSADKPTAFTASGRLGSLRQERYGPRTDLRAGRTSADMPRSPSVH